MTKMKKLLAVVLVCAIMAVCGASAFAAQNSAAARGSYPIPDSGIPYEIVGWNANRDSAGYVHMLRSSGQNKVIMTSTAGDSNCIWYCLKAPHGNMYFRSTGQDVINIYRVLKNDRYYDCTGYYYDHSTNGRDQRLSINGTKVFLSNPLIPGTWYLQADRSAVSDSATIFYTDSSPLKAQWQFWDSRYDSL